MTVGHVFVWGPPNSDAKSEGGGVWDTIPGHASMTRKMGVWASSCSAFRWLLLWENRRDFGASRLGRGRSLFPRPIGHTYLKGGQLKLHKRMKNGKKIVRLSKRHKSFGAPLEGKVPGIPEELWMAPKELASRFFQLASGHAITAPS